jgi:hypothetical protein
MGDHLLEHDVEGELALDIQARLVQRQELSILTRESLLHPLDAAEHGFAEQQDPKSTTPRRITSPTHDCSMSDCRRLRSTSTSTRTTSGAMMVASLSRLRLMS